MSLIDLMARRRALRLALAAAVLCPSVAAAQTRFTWPDTAVDVASYQTIEQCQATVNRALTITGSRDSLETGVWQDTIPVDSAMMGGGRPPLPSEVVGTAQRCLARFSKADTVDKSIFTELLPLYLQAGWDDRARTLIERRLAAIKPGHDAERATVLDSTITILLSQFPWLPIGPRRLAMIDTLAATQIPRIADRLERLRAYGALVSTIDDANPDTIAARAARIGAKMKPILDSLTPRELDELRSNYGPLAADLDAGGFAKRYVALMKLATGKRALMDSLRRSTAAYVKLLRGFWFDALGTKNPVMMTGEDPSGEPAPPVEATVWRGYDPAAGPRPTRGRVSLVVFLDPHFCNAGVDGVPTAPNALRDNCANSLTALRRLEQQFPELETTVVTHSYGFYEYLKEGVTPEREADLMKKWLETWGVRAAVAMAVPEAFHYPAPDGRRIDRPAKVENAYSFGKSHEVKHASAFLVDQDGIIVHARHLDRWSVAEDFTDMIRVLLERQQRAAR